MSKVFVIQSPKRWDERRQEMVDKYDLSGAKRFGTLAFLCGPHDTPFEAQSLEALRLGLEAFTDADHLLLIGNPVLIGWATAIAARITGGHVNVLQWSGKRRAYTSIKKRLFD